MEFARTAQLCADALRMKKDLALLRGCFFMLICMRTGRPQERKNYDRIKRKIQLG